MPSECSVITSKLSFAIIPRRSTENVFLEMHFTHDVDVVSVSGWVLCLWDDDAVISMEEEGLQECEEVVREYL